MRTSPAPTRGSVLADHDRAGRAVRVSAHPELGLVVVSVWDGARCTSTLRLAPDDVPDLVRALSTAAVVAARPVTALAS